MIFQSLLPFVTLSVCLAGLASGLPHERRTGQSYVATTPVMGYNTYNVMDNSPNQTACQQQMDALASNGFVAKGYNVFQIDSGWQAPDGSRNKTNGAIAQNLDKFPGGLQAVSSYASQKGMHFGIYTDAGVYACGTGGNVTLAGSLNHEKADSEFFASVNTAYVKIDNCWPSATNGGTFAPSSDFPSRFGNMTKALQNVGIDAQLVCQWGVPNINAAGNLEGPIKWTTDGLSTSFRLSDDVKPSWNDVMRIYNEAIYNANTGITGPGAHADADLLKVGNAGLSFAQQQTQFAYWAMVKSALIISTNVQTLSDESKTLLQNDDLIAINQDSLGKPIQLVQPYTGDHDLHSGPLANGDLATLAINMQTSTRSLTIDFSQFNVTSADVKDLLTGVEQSGVSSYTATVAGYAPIALRLSNVKKTSATSASIAWTQASSGTLSGTAAKASCSGCSEGQKVTNISGPGNTLTLNNIDVRNTTATLLFDYIDCTIGYLGSHDANQRTAQIVVNNNSALNVSFPLSGYDVNNDVAKNFRVQLAGFTVGNGNSLTISAVSGTSAPDIDRVGVIGASGSSSSGLPSACRVELQYVRNGLFAS